MMVQRNSVSANLDWISILLWLVMIGFGWMNIYSANIMEADDGIFDFSQRFGKQIIWIGASLVLAMLLLVLDAKFYIYFSYLLYILMLGILLGVLVFGKEINGAKSWFTVAMPDLWLYFLGALFIIVTLFLPRGLIGFFDRFNKTK